MLYRSTHREEARTWSPSEALKLGLCPDGGLFVPCAWPNPRPATRGLESFAEFASDVLAPFFAGDPLSSSLARVCARAFDFPLVLRQVDEGVHVLELFHGPTCAFKDFGARFLAAALAELGSSDPARSRLVLVATSGDTGGAVGSAFSSLTDIPVLILFPKGRISREQEIQLSVWGESVRAVAVDGSFDDCQRLVKQAFRDPVWQARYNLISANSINIGRLLPQMAYFAFAAMAHSPAGGRAPGGFVVPSGNLGNGTAALWARHLGFPTGPVVFAHNANRAFPEYLSTGGWRPRASVATLANAMDVGDPSNFARVHDLYPELAGLKTAASAFSVSDDEIRSAIRAEYDSTGEIWCPHTATGFHVARGQSGGGRWIIAATAHAAKFSEVIEPLLGVKPVPPPQLEGILRLPAKSVTIPASAEALKSIAGFQ